MGITGFFITGVVFCFVAMGGSNIIMEEGMAALIELVPICSFQMTVT